jgi:hypothetical protein
VIWWSCSSSRGTRKTYTILVRKAAIGTLLSNEHQGLTSEIKRPEREANHSPPLSAEVKNVWSYNSILPHYVFTARCLIK